MMSVAREQLAAAVLQASETAMEAAVALLWSPLPAARDAAGAILLSLSNVHFTQGGSIRGGGASQV
jgi:hypothetical protein